MIDAPSPPIKSSPLHELIVLSGFGIVCILLAMAILAGGGPLAPVAYGLLYWGGFMGPSLLKGPPFGLVQVSFVVAGGVLAIMLPLMFVPSAFGDGHASPSTTDWVVFIATAVIGRALIAPLIAHVFRADLQP